MSNQPDNPKTDYPNSDETARNKHAYEGAEELDDVSNDVTSIDIEGRQTSNKSGKHSSVEKLAASRPEFGEGRQAQQVDGAFGDDPTHQVTGRNASPDTNRFQCSTCGRYFNTQGELTVHEPECRTAKAATAAGRESLR